jgi:tetratricopeptide (TPR) repeat protein
LTGLWPLSSQADGIDALRARSRAALARHDPIAAEVPLRRPCARGLEDALRADLSAALLARDDRVERTGFWTRAISRPIRRRWAGACAANWRPKALPQAGQDFDQALKVAPGDADLWVSIARLRFTGGEEAQAQEAAERAVTLAPRSARALAMRGMMVRALRLASGLPWFEQGLRFHPDDAGLLVEYAATLGDMGRNRDMLAAVRRLAQADPGEPRIFYLQAVLAARAGRSELARSLLQRTGTALRDLPGAMLLGGVLEYRAGNLSVAAGLLGRLARISPTISWRSSCSPASSPRSAICARSSCAGMRGAPAVCPALPARCGGAQLAGPGAEGARAKHARAA